MLRPEQVRRRILDEHTRITGWLAELEHLARRVAGGETDVGEDLLRRVHALHVFFLSHLELEERVLAPALRRQGAEGRQLAERLLHEHGAQRATLGAFCAALERPEVEAAQQADAVLVFVRDVRADMEAEERLELDPALLRSEDDPG